jgi:transglutaminase-like putative cysteine protease
MLYDISVTLDYAYAAPAAASRHILRLSPLTLPGAQQLVSGLVTADPAPDARRDGRDFFGNATVDLGYEVALSAVRFRFAGRVRRSAAAPELDLSPDLARLGQEIAEERSLAAASPHHFLGPSDRVRTAPEMTAYARALLARPLAEGMPVMAAVERLGVALHEDMTFDPSATEVSTTPLAAFRVRRGVCQDFSHIMIACLRGLGIPAGYVSGLLRTTPPEGQARLEGADAMHAWVRAWCGSEMGWVQYDPTNAVLVGPDHIVVGYGRDYSDVAPIKGAIRAAGGHAGRQLVDVIPV